MPTPPFIDDKFPPVTREDVTDGALVVQHVRMLASEMRDGFATMANKILPTLERVEGKIDDLGERVAIVERKQRDTETRLAALEAKPRRRR